MTLIGDVGLDHIAGQPLIQLVALVDMDFQPLPVVVLDVIDRTTCRGTVIFAKDHPIGD